MPSKSDKQRRYLFATKGEAWVKAHHFDEVKAAAKKGRKAKPDPKPAARKKRGRR